MAFSSLGWIAWIIIGGLAGWIASKFMGTDAQMGVPANIIVGIIGAVIGGWLLKLAPGMSDGNAGYIMSFLTALVGACVLLFILKLVFGRGRARV
ncbi:GlsB/YeaQ/YmgE family stress response membrane protein [Mobilicoccus pelagius]|uniref:GlsB/YeaQ/YmgE family stress response membrane protein n=1 Tax=Mobilicoccus pelagius NBRC 104925 TaxID=1089455 RepID=H5USQ5_9MICO|nr:GlsB/YeaQ/YmgE family stress response membrane protein [Mobilicoccus pelagius]GAB48763.1 hypothetical protein MOPEL_080_00420 [Mobilicoccus pelagius NBRC 104925]